MALRTQPTALQGAMVIRWPSRYGADDQAGTLNEITPGKVLEAVGLVRQGLVYDLAHQNGTVRFGTDPVTSALDLNCKLHDLDNLYVVDSSFFVSSTAVNPTLTIIANALRVADHIAVGSAPPAGTGAAGTGDRSCLTYRSPTCSWSRRSPSWPR